MSRIYLVRFNSDNEILEQLPVEIQGGANGDPILRIEAPISQADYTCVADFARQELGNTNQKNLGFKTTLNVEINGSPVEYWRYEYPFDSEMTQTAQGVGESTLVGTVKFLAKDIDNPTQKIPMENINFIVAQNVQDTDTKVAPSTAQVLQGQIDDLEADKRDKSTAGVSAETTPIAGTKRFLLDDGAGNLTYATMAVVDDTIQAVGDPSKSYPTLTDSGITDPDRSAGFEGNYNVRALRTDVNPPYDPEAQEVAIPGITTSDTVVTSTIFSIQDFPIKSYDAGLTLESTVQAKATAGDWILHTDIYKRDSLGVETLLQVGQEMTISSPTYTPNVVKDTIAGAFVIAAGDTIVLKSVVRAASGTATATAQFMGDPETTFTVFNFPSGTISNTKMDLLPLDGEAGKLVKSKIDGNVEITNITADEVLTDADLGITVAPVVAGKIPVTYMPLELMSYKGSFGSTGDLPVADNAGDTYRADIDFVSAVAGITFKAGDFAVTTDLLIWERDAGGLGVVSVNGKEGAVVVLVKGDIGLGSVDNTADVDKPISTAANNKNVAQDILIDDNINGMEYRLNGVPISIAKIVDLVGGFDAAQDGGDPNKINIVAQGLGGLGEGIITNASVDGDASVSIPAVPTLLTFVTNVISNDDAVIEVDDVNDKFIIKKNVTVQEGNPYRYELPLTIIATNTSQGAKAILTFTIVGSVDGIVATTTGEVGQASVQNPTITNNIPVSLLWETNVALSEQDYSLFVQSTTTLASILSWKGTIASSFTTGELVSELMSKLIYDINALGKVDLAQRTERIKIINTTNPQDADLEFALSGGEVENDIFHFLVPGTLSGVAVLITETLGPNSYPLLDVDGVTPVVGTKINGKVIEVRLVGTNLVLTSLDIDVKTMQGVGWTTENLVDHETRLNVLEALVPVSQAQVNDNSTGIAWLLNKLRVEALITEDAEAVFYKDYINVVADSNIAEETFFELLVSNVIATQTVFALTDTTGLIAGMKLTIVDNLNNEDLTIVSVDSGIQITTSATVNAYTVVNAASLCRTTQKFSSNDDILQVVIQRVTANTPQMIRYIPAVSIVNKISVELNNFIISATPSNLDGFIGISNTTDNVFISSVFVGGTSPSSVLSFDIGNGIIDRDKTKKYRIEITNSQIELFENDISIETFAQSIDVTTATNLKITGLDNQSNQLTSLAFDVLNTKVDDIFIDISTLTGVNNPVSTTTYVNNGGLISTTYPVETKRFFIETVKDIDLVVLENEVIDTGLDSVITMEASISVNDVETPVVMTEDTDAKEVTGTNVVQAFSYKAGTAGDKVLITKKYIDVETDVYTGGKVFIV